MKGHEAVLKLRLEKRIKPDLIWLNDFPCKTGFLDWQSATATICVHGDHIETLDMRFLTGLHVRAIGETEKRTRALFDACIMNQALSVAAAHVGREGIHWDSLVLYWEKDKGMIYG